MRDKTYDKKKIMWPFKEKNRHAINAYLGPRKALKRSFLSRLWLIESFVI